MIYRLVKGLAFEVEPYPFSPEDNQLFEQLEAYEERLALRLRQEIAAKALALRQEGLLEWKTEKVIRVRKDLFRRLEEDPTGDGDFCYRVDMQHCWIRIPGKAFNLPRKFDTDFSDEEALGDILRGLPDGQGLFRLCWFNEWPAVCRYIADWKTEGEEIVVTRIRKTVLDAIPGIQTRVDPDVPRAVVTYVIESLDGSDQRFSSLEIPFALTETLGQGLTWRA